jgi:hypothetical protein
MPPASTAAGTRKWESEITAHTVEPDRWINAALTPYLHIRNPIECMRYEKGCQRGAGYL